MKVIFASSIENPQYTNLWRERFGPCEFVLTDKLLTVIGGGEDSLAAEAIMIDMTGAMEWSSPLIEDDMRSARFLELENAFKIVKDLRALPSYVAMNDGRKWCSLPVVVLLSQSLHQDVKVPDVSRLLILFSHGDVISDLEHVRTEVATYIQSLLNELDNLGLLVSYDQGRYRVGPALTPRDRRVEGDLYFGRADKRFGARGKLYTLDRDNLGVQYEVELFEALINRSDVSEPDIQKFFEQHPHFLTFMRLMQAVPQVRLTDPTGALLIPDFILKPIVAVQRVRDSNWEVLDLKLPQVRLLAGTSNHKRFSAEVFKAITQVKDYRAHFENPQNAETISSLLGHPLKHPKLAVLIGRMPPQSEVELLEKAQAREPEVRIVTYDEILEQQKQLMK